jgi:ribosome biogenesis protein Nip4
MEISRFVRQFGKEQSVKLPEENIRKIGRRNYLVSEDLWNLKLSLDRDSYSVGLFLGEEKDRFYPSPALLDLISLDTSADRRVFVNDKAEWLFLCGRNILESSITKKTVSEGMVLVQNKKDENLGYGTFLKQGDVTVIKNILDRGSYLRVNESGRGRKKK